MLRDDAQLRQLHQRLKGLPPLRFDDMAEARRRFEAGKHDAQVRQLLAGSKQLRKHAHASAIRGGHAATIGMSHVLLADMHDGMTPLDGRVSANNVVSAARAAVAAWPDASTKAVLADALFQMAVFDPHHVNTYHMRYDITFATSDGERFRLRGFKVLKIGNIANGWTATTTLFTP